MRRGYDFEINSIPLAINKCKKNIQSNKSVNDDLYRIFCDFYYSMIDKLNSNQEDIDKLNENDLEINGLVRITGEAGPFLHKKSNFIKSIFYDYVSEGVQKYIDIENKASILMREGYLFEDALHTISWNDLSDLIVAYEKYIEAYCTYWFEIRKAQNSLNFFLIVYTQYLDTQTFSYMSGESDNEYELRDSYLRFAKIYPDSKYQPIIKGYLEILKNNGFTFDDKAKKYLSKNGIEVL